MASHDRVNALTAPEADMREIADALVIFGATGDLARKKLYPALFRLAARGRLRVPVVGVARSAWDDDQLRSYACESVRLVNGMAPTPTSTRSPGTSHT